MGDEIIQEPTIKATISIDPELYHQLKRLGLIPNEVRKSNVGNSDYSKHIIQPWSVWLDWNLDPWDADIVKRISRVKADAGYTPTEQRILDYEKIKHICDEKIRQLKCE